jgi:hypothetical protein
VGRSVDAPLSSSLSYQSMSTWRKVGCGTLWGACLMWLSYPRFWSEQCHQSTCRVLAGHYPPRESRVKNEEHKLFLLVGM